MGSVPDVYTTGDNDPEIEPVQYYRHYLYCDACGSFELDSWIVPDNHGILEKTRQRLAMAAFLLSPVVVVSGWLALGPPSSVLLAGVIVIVGLLVARGILGSKIKIVGMRCRRCGSTYAHGTPFFTDLDANPRDLTVADVPRPLGRSPFLVGESVKGELPRPPSRLPA